MRSQLKLGFTLIEVLVTLVILMFGLLGIAGLMAKGQRTSFEAYQRHQALALANDMAERMRANRTRATDYVLATPVGLGTTPMPTNCDVTDCTPAVLVDFDKAQWDDLLNGYSETLAADGTRVGGIISARGCIEEIANTAATCPPPVAPPRTMFTRTNRVSVAWQGNDATVSPTTTFGGVPQPLNCANGLGLYGADDARRRVVAIDVMLLLQCP